MPSLVQIIIESIAFQAVFYAIYLYGLRAKVSFPLQRLYLLLMPAIAVVLPLLPLLFYAFLQGTVLQSRMEWIGWLEKRLPDVEVTIGVLLKAIYFLGFSIAAFRLIDRLWEVRRTLLEKFGHTFTSHTWQGSPFACFSYYFWHGWSMSEQQEREWVQHWLPLPLWSTLEVVWMEALAAVFWFSPLVHFFKISLQQLHRQPATGTLTDIPPLAHRFVTLAFLALFALTGAVHALLRFTEKPSAKLANAIESFSGLVLFKHEKPGAHTYHFEWGSQSVPLSKFANPNGFAGEIELDLTEFRQILAKEEIKVFKDGKRIKTGILSILYESSKTGERAYINDIDPGTVVLKDRRTGKIFNDSLQPGDELTLFGEAADIYLSKVQIRIKDPGAPYKPAVKVPAINHLEPSFGWQIITRTGRRTLVKVDPTQPGIQRIIELYGNPERYEIVSIPGFRTNRRYVAEEDALFRKGSIAEVHVVQGLPDPSYLSEFQSYHNQEVSLFWGQLEASPSSRNYSLDEFRTSSKESLRLTVGDKSLPIVAFEIIFAGNRPGIPTGYFTDSTGHPFVMEALDGLQPKSSVYFDNIIVQDENGFKLLFPVAFAFHIGN